MPQKVAELLREVVHPKFEKNPKLRYNLYRKGEEELKFQKFIQLFIEVAIQAYL